MYKQWDKIPGMDDLFPTLNFRRNGPDKVDKGPRGLPRPYFLQVCEQGHFVVPSHVLQARYKRRCVQFSFSISVR